MRSSRRLWYGVLLALLLGASGTVRASGVISPLSMCSEATDAVSTFLDAGYRSVQFRFDVIARSKSKTHPVLLLAGTYRGVLVSDERARDCNVVIRQGTRTLASDASSVKGGTATFQVVAALGPVEVETVLYSCASDNLDDALAGLILARAERVDAQARTATDALFGNVTALLAAQELAGTQPVFHQARDIAARQAISAMVTVGAGRSYHVAACAEGMLKRVHLLAADPNGDVLPREVMARDRMELGVFRAYTGGAYCLDLMPSGHFQVDGGQYVLAASFGTELLRSRGGLPLAPYALASLESTQKGEA